MFENIMKFFNKLRKKEEKTAPNSKEAAKERLHLVLMQDRANVSADFLELMKQEIIEVIKKYIDIDEGAIDVRLTNKENEDGTNGAPALYANIPILNIKNEVRKMEKKQEEIKEDKQEQSKNQNKEDIEQSETEKETKLEIEKQEDKTEEKNKSENSKIEGEDKNKDENQEIDKQEENTDSENKQDIAEEKETKEELNQKK